MFSAKELTRQMSSPQSDILRNMGDVGAILKGQAEHVSWYRFHREGSTVDTHSDTDLAGCKRARRKITVGPAVLGHDLVWCRPQAIIPLSWAEAALFGLVRVSAETLGLMPLARDLGMSLPASVMGAPVRLSPSPKGNRSVGFCVLMPTLFEPNRRQQGRNSSGAS